MNKLEVTQQEVSNLLNQIAEYFVEGSKLTLMVRQPNKPDQDFMLSNDDMDQVIEMAQRRRDEQTN